MDLTKRLALGTENEAKYAEVAIRFLKETNTLFSWFEYTKDSGFKRYTNNKGVIEWWKIGPFSYCTSIFGNHNFGGFLRDKKHKFRTNNFTVCFCVFIYMNYDDSTIIKYKLLEPDDFKNLILFKEEIDLYYKTREKPKLRNCYSKNYQFASAFNSLIDSGCIDKWYITYKRKFDGK